MWATRKRIDGQASEGGRRHKEEKMLNAKYKNEYIRKIMRKRKKKWRRVESTAKAH